MDEMNVDAVPMSPRSALQQLESLVVELVTALGQGLNHSAQEPLERAAALLRTVQPRRRPAAEPKGGLAPWQIRKVSAHIEANLGQPLRSGDLARLVRLSPGHFSRTFRSSFGCSPLQYVMRRRVERAQRLMLSTDTPLAQIALDCGLADQAHFSRVFRKVVGVSPRAWRRARCGALED